MEYQDIIDKYGIKMHYDSLRKSQQTPFGTVATTQYLSMKNDKSCSLSDAREVLGEQYIVKQQIHNDRLKLNKLKRELVPCLTVADELKQYMKDNNFSLIVPEYMYEPIVDNSRYTMVCPISDWHIGYVIENCEGNYFNWEIANERVNKYISECRKYINLYGIKKVYVINCGDTIESVTMRYTQNQFCEFYQAEQINKAIELIYRFIVAIGRDCEVVYGGISGNHDRTNGEKSENYDGDNVNSTITPLLKEMFEIAENKRVHVVERDYSDKEIVNEICGVKCKFVHGHAHSKDDKQKLKNEMSMDNEIYTLYCEGHWHNFRALSENRGRYIITNGCLSGFNDYSTTFGCATNASQSLIVLGDREIEMIKAVDLQ